MPILVPGVMTADGDADDDGDDDDEVDDVAALEVELLALLLDGEVGVADALTDGTVDADAE